MTLDGAAGHQWTVRWLLDGDGQCGGSSTAIEQAPPPSAHLWLIMQEQKLFPATKDSYRIYIGRR